MASPPTFTPRKPREASFPPSPEVGATPPKRPEWESPRPFGEPPAPAQRRRAITCWYGGTVWQGRTAMWISVSSWATIDRDVDRGLKPILLTAGEAGRPPEQFGRPSGMGRRGRGATMDGRFAGPGRRDTRLAHARHRERRFVMPRNWVALSVQVFLAVDRSSHSVSDTLCGIFPYIVPS